jgi:hypothetical protein
MFAGRLDAPTVSSLDAPTTYTPLPGGHMRFALGTTLALAASLALSTTGCGAIKKVQECGKMTTTINDGLTKAKAALAQPNPAGFRKFADAYDEIGANIGKLDISTDELKKDQAAYQTMAKNASKAARDFASALEAKDVKKEELAKKEFDKVKNEEDALVQKINNSCH